MVHLLNADDRILVGMERYKYVASEIKPDYFTKEKFLAPDPSETNIVADTYLDPLKEKWDPGDPTYIGDKVPSFFRLIPYLRKTFPGSKMIFLFRDLEEVANSFNRRATNPEDHWPRENDYREAVKLWNSSLLHLKKSYRKNDTFIAPYEKLFSGDLTQLESFYRFLELDLTDQAIEGFKQLTSGWEERRAASVPLSEAERAHLEVNQARKLKEWCLQQIEIQSDSASRVQ